MKKTSRTAAALISCLLAGAAGASPLEDLAMKAEATRTDALYVAVDGEAVIDWRPDGRHPQTIETMSVMKSLVAIAIGRLLHDGQLESLDTPVYEIYPEWKQGDKQKITIRHLMNHTSGLQNHRSTLVEIYPAPDVIKLALAAELESAPGSKFSYNNKAVNLLAGVIERLSGQRMDLYFEDKLFEPLGIHHYQWDYDETGNPYAMSGLGLYAKDLAKFGQLLLNGGTWDGERLLAGAYIDEMLAAGQPYVPSCGLLWWRQPASDDVVVFSEDLEDLAATLPAAIREPLLSMKDERFRMGGEAGQALRDALGEDGIATLRDALGKDGIDALFDFDMGEVIAYNANGYLGQYLVIVPSRNVVAVRQIEYKKGLDEKTAWRSFARDITDYAMTLPQAD